jgi:hypothetical protein
MEKRWSLQQMLLEKVIYAGRKLKGDPCLSPCISINSKCIKDLHIRPETLQLVHKRALEAIGTGKYLFSRTPAAQQLRERMDEETTHRVGEILC